MNVIVASNGNRTSTDQPQHQVPLSIPGLKWCDGWHMGAETTAEVISCLGPWPEAVLRALVASRLA